MIETEGRLSDADIAHARRWAVHPAVVARLVRRPEAPTSSVGRALARGAEIWVSDVLRGALLDPTFAGLGADPGADVSYLSVDGPLTVEVKLVEAAHYRFAVPQSTGRAARWDFGALVLNVGDFQYRLLGVVPRAAWEAEAYLFTGCPLPMYVVDRCHTLPAAALPAPAVRAAMG